MSFFRFSLLRRIWVSKTAREQMIMLATCVLALFAIIGTILNGYFTQQSNELTRKSNERAEKVFGAQIRPLIQAIPVKFTVEKDSSGRIFGTTTVRIINFSNFDALQIRTDVMYEGAEWIREWQEAKVKDCEHRLTKGQMTNEETAECGYYGQNLHKNIGDLKVEGNGVQLWVPPTESHNTEDLGQLHVATGSQVTTQDYVNGGRIPIATGDVTVPNSAETGRKRIEYLTQEWRGACPSEDDICKNRQFLIAVRAIWENERWREFETIDYYILRCARTGVGVSFTFIPKYLSSESVIQPGE